jgi:hypothetical protein
VPMKAQSSWSSPAKICRCTCRWSFVPDRPPPRGKDGADAEEEGQGTGLEDPALGVPERPALALEQEPSPDVLMAQN